MHIPSSRWQRISSDGGMLILDSTSSSSFTQTTSPADHLLASHFHRMSCIYWIRRFQLLRVWSSCMLSPAPNNTSIWPLLYQIDDIFSAIFCSLNSWYMIQNLAMGQIFIVTSVRRNYTHLHTILLSRAWVRYQAMFQIWRYNFYIWFYIDPTEIHREKP